MSSFTPINKVSKSQEDEKNYSTTFTGLEEEEANPNGSSMDAEVGDKKSSKSSVASTVDSQFTSEASSAGSKTEETKSSKDQETQDATDRATPEEKDSIEVNGKPTTKKRRAARAGNETPPAKKRASPKGKVAAKKGNAKKDDDDHENSSPAKNRSPTKSKAAASAGNTAKVDNATLKRSPARKRAATDGPTAAPTAIPKSWEEASAADKLMMEMKENGKSWGEIRAAYAEAEGKEEKAGSTLPNRYNRIKANMMHFKEGDDQLMLACKAEIESTFEHEKWGRIAALMGTKGGDTYPVAFLQKKHKEIVKAAENQNAAAVAIADLNAKEKSANNDEEI